MNPGSGVTGLGGVGVLARTSFCGGGGNFGLYGSGVLTFGGDSGGLDISLATGFVGLICLGVDGGRGSRSDGSLLDTVVSSFSYRFRPSPSSNISSTSSS